MFIGRSASKKKSRYQVEIPALGRTAMRSGSASDNTSRPRCAFANMGNMRTGICRSHIGSGSAVACSKRRAAERSVPERRSAGHKIRGCNNRRARPCGTSSHRRVVTQTRRQAMPRLPLGSLGWQIFSPSCPPRNACSLRLAVQHGTTLHRLYNTRTPSAHVCLQDLSNERLRAQARRTLPRSGLYWSRSNGL